MNYKTQMSEIFCDDIQIWNTSIIHLVNKSHTSAERDISKGELHDTRIDVGASGLRREGHPNIV